MFWIIGVFWTLGAFVAAVPLWIYGVGLLVIYLASQVKVVSSPRVEVVSPWAVNWPEKVESEGLTSDRAPVACTSDLIASSMPELGSATVQVMKDNLECMVRIVAARWTAEEIEKDRLGFGSEVLRRFEAITGSNEWPSVEIVEVRIGPPDSGRPQVSDAESR